MHFLNQSLNFPGNNEFIHRQLLARDHYGNSSSRVNILAFFLFKALRPLLISAIKVKSERTARVSFRLSNSSGLTRTAAGRPFLVMTISSSVALTVSISPLTFIFASDTAKVFIF